MHGAAVTFSKQVIESGRSYDLVLANDMMDVAVFKALVRSAGVRIPIACYFHENQISYPISSRDTDLSASRDLHYGYINYTTALASDILYFNSHYHRKTFIDSLPAFLASFPDFQNKDTVRQIAEKAEVLPLGLDLVGLDSYKVQELPRERPILLWNHRWEYDKRPEAFLNIVLELDRRGLDFDIALLGERGSDEPDMLHEVRAQLKDRVLQDGPVEDFATYAGWLWRASILPVTSEHDFFGASVVEAIYCGCHPVLPNRLSYPEHVKDNDFLYQSEEEAIDKITQLIVSEEWREPLRISSEMLRYDWSRLKSPYDFGLSGAASRENCS
jgi:glycosyltransferase involved in cell wall biosynthesis